MKSDRLQITLVVVFLVTVGVLGQVLWRSLTADSNQRDVHNTMLAPQPAANPAEEALVTTAKPQEQSADHLPEAIGLHAERSPVEKTEHLPAETAQSDVTAREHPAQLASVRSPRPQIKRSRPLRRRTMRNSATAMRPDESRDSN